MTDRLFSTFMIVWHMASMQKLKEARKSTKLVNTDTASSNSQKGRCSKPESELLEIYSTTHWIVLLWG